MPPTLLVKGNLLETKYSEKQKILDDLVPIEYIINRISPYVENNNVTKQPIKGIEDKIFIIRASTGSGKSTVMLSELQHTFGEQTNRNIACTQPRVLTAISIPVEQVAPFNNAKFLEGTGKKPLILGENLGFQTGMEINKPIKGLIYMTVGVLVQQLNTMSDEDFMNKYSFIIIDEAHELSSDVILLLYVMKKFLKKNYKEPKCPILIITSATFDPYYYANYFMNDLPDKKKYKNIIDVKGSSYPIEDHFIQYDSSNFITQIIDQIIHIHTHNPQDFLDYEHAKKIASVYNIDDIGKDNDDKTFRDIAVFLPGAFEISVIAKELEIIKHAYVKEFPILVVQITGTTVAKKGKDFTNLTENINKLKFNGKKVTRRIILGTNAMETGLTIDTLRYVIDSGWVNSAEYSPIYNCSLLITKPVTQSMWKQRRGRSGRKAPGVAYAMYTEESYNMMQEIQYPDIIKSDITSELLNILIRMVDVENISGEHSIYDLFVKERINNITNEIEKNTSEFQDMIQSKKVDLYNIDLLYSPGADLLHSAVQKLFILGAIDSNMIPTNIGFIMNRIRKISPESIKMILTGQIFNICASDLVLIACCIENGNVMGTSREAVKLYDAKKNELSWLGYDLKDRLYVADEFIRYLIIMNHFREIVYKYTSPGKLNIKKIKIWCDDLGLNYNSMIDVYNLHDEILVNLAAVGIKPFKGNKISKITDKNLDDKMQYVKNIKKCIFEGYKQNICLYNPSENGYLVRYNNKSIDVKHTYDEPPKYIILGNIRIKNYAKYNVYYLYGDTISVIDGYINYDNKFDIL